VVHIPIWASLVVIAVVAGGAMGASVWRDRRLPVAERQPVAELRGRVRT
jgi:hypothetical protein